MTAVMLLHARGGIPLDVGRINGSSNALMRANPGIALRRL